MSPLVLYFGVRLAPGADGLSLPGGRGLPPGRYRLALARAQATTLEIDDGRGFAADQGLALPAGRAIHDFRLPRGARALRIDDRAAAASVRRVTGPEFAARFLARLVAQRGRRGMLGWSLDRGLALLLSDGPAAVLRKLRSLDAELVSAPGDYERWMTAFEQPDEPERLAAAAAALDPLPKLLLLLPAGGAAEAAGLAATLDSLRGQFYRHWTLRLLVPPGPHLQFDGLADGDSRIVLQANSFGLAEAKNAALAGSDNDWVAVLEPGSRLRPHTLAALLVAIDAQTRLVYADSDRMDAAGRRAEPWFKPDFSPELLAGQDYFGAPSLMRSEAVRSVGGWQPAFEGAEDFDLELRLAAGAPEGIRHVPHILCHHSGGRPGPADVEAGRRALAAHLVRLGRAARIEAAPVPGCYRVCPTLPEPAPLVSLVMPTRDHPDLLRRAVGSILEKTLYRPFELLVVDNGSSEPEALLLLTEIAALPEVRVLRRPGPFNFSALNNDAVTQTRGSLLALVNNDIDVITPDWLGEMVGWASQPEIGCVGARLLYPDDTVQHAGVVLGLGGAAGHAFKHFPRHADGGYGRLQLVRNVAAVTAACLVVRKAVYDQVGGFDAVNLPVNFNDVDFCLRVGKAGYRNIVTPFAELYHHESATRGFPASGARRRNCRDEVAYLQASWTLEDRYYSPNLTRRREDFSLGEAPVMAGRGDVRAAGRG